MKTEDLDELVKQYLLAKGYSNTIQELQKESAKINNNYDCADSAGKNSAIVDVDVDADGDSVVMDIDKSNKTVAELKAANSDNSGSKEVAVTTSTMMETISNNLLNAMTKEVYFGTVHHKDFSLYHREFSQLRSWVDNSLDMVKHQLLAFSFPVFVHCYLDLLAHKQSEIARAFWHQFSKIYLDFYSEEMHSLNLLVHQDSVETAELLSVNDFIKQAKESKFTVFISSMAYQLLTSFLLQNNLLLVANIVNLRVKFKKLQNIDREFYSLLALEGYKQGIGIGLTDDIQTKLPTVPLGVPGQIDDNNKNVGRIPNTRTDPYYQLLLDEVLGPQLVVNLDGRDNRSRMDADDSTRLGKKRFRDDTSDLPKGRSLDPSIVFATVTNSSEGIICMDINSSVSQIAAGFQDCCVRVWSLNKDDTHTSSVDVSYTFSEVLPMSKHSLDKKKSSNMTSQASSSSMMVAGIAATDYGNGNRDNRMDTKDDDESNTSLIEFRGHSMPVYCVHQHGVINSSSNIQSHDSRWILSGSADKTIRLWDMTIGHCVSKYFSTSAVWSVQFNPLGYYFASGNHDKSVTVYSMDRNEPLRYLREHLNDVNAVQWHPNSALLLSGSDDRTIRLWDIRTANCARILKGATSPVTALAVSPTGETAVGGCEDGKIYTWDLASGKALTVMMGHKRNEPVYSINYSNDSKSIISGGADCSVRIWDALQARAKRGLHAHDRHSNSTDNKAVTAMDRVIKHTDSQLVLYPKHTFYTKSCPVYYANYNLQNLAFAGGAFSLSYATGSHATETAADELKGKVSELDIIPALGMASAVYSNN